MISVSPTASQAYILTITCVDAVGIVAAVATFLAKNDAFIIESAHHGDEITHRFFMRTVFRPAGAGFPGLEKLKASFGSIATRFGMGWAMDDKNYWPRVVIAVSKFGHCLTDLLHRWHSGTLPINIVGVVSNHEKMRRTVGWYDIPYHYLPVDRTDKEKQQQDFLDVVERENADFVVLARYMQVLSDEFCQKLAGRCINIHHSFLPSFRGAKPYHQAFSRGVKIIGATAHYVTPVLDEGPIIEQETARVDHSQSPDQLVAVGRDIETIVLARAVLWHAEKRILPNGQKTVVFR